MQLFAAALCLLALATSVMSMMSPLSISTIAMPTSSISMLLPRSPITSTIVTFTHEMYSTVWITGSGGHSEPRLEGGLMGLAVTTTISVPDATTSTTSSSSSTSSTSTSYSTSSSSTSSKSSGSSNMDTTTPSTVHSSTASGPQGSHTISSITSTSLDISIVSGSTGVTVVTGRPSLSTTSGFEGVYTITEPGVVSTEVEFGPISTKTLAAVTTFGVGSATSGASGNLYGFNPLAGLVAGIMGIGRMSISNSLVALPLLFAPGAFAMGTPPIVPHLSLRPLSDFSSTNTPHTTTEYFTGSFSFSFDTTLSEVPPPGSLTTFATAPSSGTDWSTDWSTAVETSSTGKTSTATSGRVASTKSQAVSTSTSSAGVSTSTSSAGISTITKGPAATSTGGMEVSTMTQSGGGGGVTITKTKVIIGSSTISYPGGGDTVVPIFGTAPASASAPAATPTKKSDAISHNGRLNMSKSSVVALVPALVFAGFFMA